MQNQDFEKLGVFYLGKQYDLKARETTDRLLLYDAKDLTTHAVCVGMTGSGKTGLCISLLEEAAIDGIPAICIDPKGDIGNLMLSFPLLRGEDFAPWVDPAEATRRGQTTDELAVATAKRWKEGLAEWGQDGERIQRYRDAVDVAIYTPGSSAGLPLTVLRSFNAPTPAVRASADALRERVTSAVSGLLALLGIEADPLRSREHILLANIVDRAWREGQDLTPADMIHGIQQPPFEKVGVFDLESFFPAQDRFELAMRLNNVLASPGFAAWMTGEALDVQRLLFTAEGKPRLSILSIAHLSDAERMFFVTILLNEVVAWMRSQSGTSSLRAILYMDEIFGFFPPVAMPPSKTPLLTLMKQARAFGLGVVLATQNPVDIDYKGLSNAGTWFLGRLQTERDKARVLEGLEGASVAAGATFNRQQMEATLAGLEHRVFLMNNVHDDQPVVFQTRWALSYLRGPLTRSQIETLMSDRRAATTSPRAAAERIPAAPQTRALPAAGDRPALPPDVPQVFIARRCSLAAGEALLYRAALLGSAKMHFTNSTAKVDEWQDVSMLLLAEDLSGDAWDSAELTTDEPEFDSHPDAAARFADLPPEFSRAKQYAAWTNELRDYLYRHRVLKLWRCKPLREISLPGEAEGDFRVRLTHAARELRDQQAEKLRAKYAPKLASLEEKLRKAQQRVEREKTQASQHTFQAAITFGASILSAFTGRKLASSTNIGRAATSARAASRAAQQRADVGQAEESVEAVRQQLGDLEDEFKLETDKLDLAMRPDALELDELEIKPKKSEINVTRVALAWVPYKVSTDGVVSSGM